MSGKKAKEFRRACYNLFVVKRPKCSFQSFYKAARKEAKAGRAKVARSQ